MREAPGHFVFEKTYNEVLGFIQVTGIRPTETVS